MLRYLRRHLGLLAAMLVAALALGIAYRYLFNPLEERTLAFYLRSCVHAIGMAFAGWTVQMGFAALPRSQLGSALRRKPLAVEFALKALAMTAALTIVTLGLQFALYPSTSKEWYAQDLPRIVVLAFVVSLLFGAIFEFRRLVGGRVLGSFFLGTYHRPQLEQRIVMFLDLAGSTALAERLGEVRVHDLITRFFFDIDAPIADHDGEVHAYVGDQVIVSWPLSAGAARNARWLHCFFATQDTIDTLAPAYAREFGVVPQFRAGVHAGSVVVSECGDARRQIAYFGDTMNVAARLCEYCKAAGDALVASAELLRNTAVPPGFAAGAATDILPRGRQSPIAVHAIRREKTQPVLMAAGAAA
jgi:class 3 adenylate cyclase